MNTRSDKICDTVKFISYTIPIPKTNIDDYLRKAASDIISILTRQPSIPSPTFTTGDLVRNAPLELVQQFTRAEPMRNTAPVSKDTHPINKTALAPRVEASSKAPITNTTQILRVGATPIGPITNIAEAPRVTASASTSTMR